MRKEAAMTYFNGKAPDSIRKLASSNLRSGTRYRGWLFRCITQSLAENKYKDLRIAPFHIIFSYLTLYNVLSLNSVVK